jgi:hypothetical protein
MAVDTTEIEQNEVAHGSAFITEKTDLNFQDAAEGTLIEHQLTTREAAYIYWKGIIWCLVL